MAGEQVFEAAEQAGDEGEEQGVQRRHRAAGAGQVLGFGADCGGQGRQRIRGGNVCHSGNN